MPDDANLIGPISNQGRINIESAWSAECVLGCQFSRCDLVIVHHQVVFNVWLKLSAAAQVLVHGQYGNSRVASVAPLRAASILDEPVCDRLDELVGRINGQQRSQSEGSSFNSALGPTPVDAVFAPVCSGNHRILR